MSYSFTVLARNKRAAKAQVAREMAKAAAQQPPHAHDMHAACTAANAFIDALGDDDSKDVSVAMYGSASHDYQQPADGFGGETILAASMNVSAALVTRSTVTPAS